MKDFVKCDYCGIGFYKRLKKEERNQNIYDDIQVKKRHFCCPECSYAYSREHDLPGRFELGHEPWNKGTKGECKSNSGSFRKGQRPKTWLPVGTITVRIEKKRNRRHWIKIAEPNKWLEFAKWVWIQNYGKIPKGFVVYHINRNTLNDNIENLKLITRKELLFKNDKKKEGLCVRN
jgi:hypothetical protein